MDPSNPFLNVFVILWCTAFCDMKTYELTFQDTERWVLPFILDLATASFLWHRDFLFSSVLLGYSWEKLCSSHPVSQDQWYSFLKGNKCWFQCKNIISTYLQKKNKTKDKKHPCILQKLAEEFLCLKAFTNNLLFKAVQACKFLDKARPLLLEQLQINVINASLGSKYASLY